MTPTPTPGREVHEPTGKPEEVIPPEIVGWDDEPPPSLSSKRSMWDDTIAAVLARDDDKWAKVRKPPRWNSSSLQGLRKSYKGLDFINPILERSATGKAKASDYLWVRRKDAAKVNGQGEGEQSAEGDEPWH